MKLNRLLLLIIIAIFSVQCKTDTKEKPSEKVISAPEIIKIRIADEPDRLNPMLAGSANATQIFAHLLQPLVEFDPHTLKESPILVKSLPIETKIQEGPYKGGIAFDYEIRDDAVWEDGQAVTIDDYLFTIKAVFSPG
ncbi:MAG: hypothetical protein AAGK97_16250, partial [Bacteroidota bacterium]